MFRPFGSGNNTSPFGTPQLQQQSQPQQQQQQQGAFGGFGSTTSAFGAPPATTAQTSSFGSAFGQTAGFASANPRYSTTIDSENNVTITLQTITAMPAYANKSLEELRLEDYLAGRKGGNSNNGPFGAIGGPVSSAQNTFGGSSSGGIFGQTAGPAPANPFGGNNTFGGSSGNLFGNNASQPTTATNVPAAPGTFGSFGSTAAQQPSGGLFGPSMTSNNAAQAGNSFSGGFGAFNKSAGSVNPFGGLGTSISTGTSGGGLFGTAPVAAPAPGGLFGTTPASGGLFGAAPASGGLFGTTTQPSNSLSAGMLGKPATTTGGFSFNQPSGNTMTPFGVSAPGGITSGAAGLFGQPAASQQPTMNTASAPNSLFGTSTQTAAPGGFSFGGGFGTNSAIGQPTNTAQSTGLPLLGGNGTFNNMGGSGPFSTTTATAPSSTGAGMFNFGTTNQQATQQQQQQQQQQQPNSGGFSFNFGGNTSNAATTLPSLNLQNSTLPTGSGTNPSFSFGNSTQPANTGGSGFSFNFAGGQNAGTTANTGLSSYPTANNTNLPLISADALSIKPPLPAAFATPKDQSSLLTSFTNDATTKKIGGGSTASSSSTFTRSPARFTPRSSFRLQPPTESQQESLSVSTLPNGSVVTALGYILPRRVSAKKLVIQNTTTSSSSSGAHHHEGGRIFSRVPSLESLGPISGGGDGEEEREALSLGMSQTTGNDIDAIGRDEKFMIPNETTLRKLPYAQLSAVKNFTVGEHGIGQVRFLQPIDLTKIVLDDVFTRIVVFQPRMITLYPDDEFTEEEKPSIGSGLNVPAEIRLERCWCVNKADRQPIKDMGDPKLQAHLERLKSIPDTHFIDYIPESGTWVFRVEHF